MKKRKRKRLKLTILKIDSFITEMNTDKIATIKGGLGAEFDMQKDMSKLPPCTLV